MKTIERLSVWLRHAPVLERAHWLWDRVRPLYERTVGFFGRNGLERMINGTDHILVSPEARGAPENYEPDVWRVLMNELRAGDTFVDVGAYIGLYAVAVGLRVRSSGRVVAFEPDPDNFLILEKHIRLNKLAAHVELHRAAVSDRTGNSAFLTGGSSEARLVFPSVDNHADTVKTVTLDGALGGTRIDILKIDVEGHETKVLRGAENLLRTPSLRPRAIFVEVHPYAWESIAGESTALLELLNTAGYRVQTLDGQHVSSIERYGEVIARI